MFESIINLFRREPIPTIGEIQIACEVKPPQAEARAIQESAPTYETPLMIFGNQIRMQFNEQCGGAVKAFLSDDQVKSWFADIRENDQVQLIATRVLQEQSPEVRDTLLTAYMLS